MSNTILFNGGCLEVMKNIPDKSIDFVLTDPPYGTTACKWDSVIPFEPMWTQLKRVIKDKGAIALFGSEPFSSYLRMSNIKQYKYDLVWKKTRATNFLHAKHQPLNIYENIIIFCNKNTFYFPIMAHGKTHSRNITPHKLIYEANQKRKEKNTYNTSNEYYPLNIIEYKKDFGLHPTQKPVALLEYLIKTYTLEGETVLDFTMGSGSTGVACKNTGRGFIGIEKDFGYFKIAQDRINAI